MKYLMSILFSAIRLAGWVLLSLVLSNQPAFSGESENRDGSFKVYGDFRLRLESDWNSQNSDCTRRDDRLRAMVRMRLGMNYYAGDKISLGLRLRSGSDEGQQITNMTLYDFTGHDTGDSDFNFDKWYMKYQDGGFSGWIGRNTLPYWRQNLLIWDDDVVPAGIALSYTKGKGNREITLNGGLFSLPAGMQAFSGQMAMGQIVVDAEWEDVGLTLAGGVRSINADSDDSDGLLLLDNNNERDYTIWQGSMQARIKVFKRPLQIGLDIAHNSEDYDDAGQDSFTRYHQDDKTGYALTFLWGDNERQGDWLVSYTYAYIEMFATNSSYTEDDWVRWGTSTQLRVTNFRGHGFRGVYMLPRNFHLDAHLFIVNAINKRSPADLCKEDGNRFRVDLIYKY